MEIKLNDVYWFQYNDFYKSRHCFEGKLIVIERNNKLYLQDIYWGINDSRNKIFTLEKILQEGTLTFMCNLDEVNECSKDDYKYYNYEDLFDLSYQHGYCSNYYRKKNAVRSNDRMEEVIKDRIKEYEHEIEYNIRQKEIYKEKLIELENGNLDIYI